LLGSPQKAQKNSKKSKNLTKSQAFKFTIARKPPKKLKKSQKKSKNLKKNQKRNSNKKNAKQMKTCLVSLIVLLKS
jgi:hypothetical protein